MKSRFKTKKLLLLGILLFGLSVATWAQKVSLNYTNVELQDVLLSIKSKPVMYWCLVIRYWMYTEEYR